MPTIKIQVPRIYFRSPQKSGFKVKLVIPKVIVKETHNSRYLSCDDPRHSQK